MTKRTPNTNFRLGLNRQELIQAAQMFGKSEKTAKKDSTKRLEEYLTRRITGAKNPTVPNLTDRQKQDIRSYSEEYGVYDALHSAAYYTRKAVGSQDENNFLRLTVARTIPAYYNGVITNDIIDDMVAKLDGDKNEIISGIINGDYYYDAIFRDYFENLAEQSANQNAIAEQQAQEQFAQGVDSAQHPSNRTHPSQRKRARK